MRELYATEEPSTQEHFLLIMINDVLLRNDVMPFYSIYSILKLQTPSNGTEPYN